MTDARQPVVIFANGLGDHLLALPAMRSLGRLFGGRLALVAMRGKQNLFFRGVPFRSVCEVDVERDEEGSKRFDPAAVIRAIGPVDLLLSLHPWHSRSMDQLLERWNAPRAIGFHRNFSECIALDFKKHSADLAFDLPLLLDPRLRIEKFAKPHLANPASLRCAQAIRRSVPRSMRVLAVHADTGKWTSMGSRALDADVPSDQVLGDKMWPVEKFVELLDAFLSRHRDFVAFVVGGTDLSLDRGRLGGRVIPCCHLPVSVSMALVGLSDLFVGVDSCMLHAADLYGVPGVGLFGPTDPREFGFRFGPGIHMRGGPFMEGISPESVLEALESTLPQVRLQASASVGAAV